MRNSLNLFSQLTAIPRSGDVRARYLLIFGFVLMIALLVTDGVVGFRSSLSIRSSVDALTDTQFRTVVLIDEVQRAQSTLGSVLYRLSSVADVREREQLESRVDSIERVLQDLFGQIPKDDPDMHLWREVGQASRRVTAEADRILARPHRGQPDLSDLLQARERLITTTSQLIRANHLRAESTKNRISELGSRQLLRDAVLLSTCLLLACFCAFVVVRTATRLYNQITAQTEELGRVSWQLLEKQENLARRLSHELHDELGQSLTALKTNFTRHATAPCVDQPWMSDCSELLRESIQSAHEISQLLRPTILDDFGLDSALAWLCERFEERQRIELEYQSQFHGRLNAQAETHLFRIAQEALTNVARHSEASRVVVALSGDVDFVRLRISDNGIGILSTAPPSESRFGLTGMRARARSLSGDMTVRSFPGRGTEIEVMFPKKEHEHQKTDSYSVGR